MKILRDTDWKMLIMIIGLEFLHLISNPLAIVLRKNVHLHVRLTYYIMAYYNLIFDAILKSVELIGIIYPSNKNVSCKRYIYTTAPIYRAHRVTTVDNWTYQSYNVSTTEEWKRIQFHVRSHFVHFTKLEI